MSGVDELIVNGFIASLVFVGIVCYGYILNPNSESLIILVTTVTISALLFGGLLYLSKKELLNNKSPKESIE